MRPPKPSPREAKAVENRTRIRPGLVVVVPALLVLGLWCCAEESPNPPTSPSSPTTAEPSSPEQPLTWRGRPLPPTARLDTHETVTAVHDYGPSDGGGRAEFVEAPEVMAGSSGQWVIDYFAGPEGIAIGGSIHLQISPFWGWSEPQAEWPELEGFTTAECEVAGAEFQLQAAGNKLIILHLEGAPLTEGDRVRITYGAGSRGARADQYAESLEYFFLWVDGDGDGTRKLIDSDLKVRITPRPAADFVVFVPSSVRTGDEIWVSIAFLDSLSNVDPRFTGEVSLSASSGLKVPESVTLSKADRGAVRVKGVVEESGVHLVTAEFRDATRESNPMVASSNPRPMLWGDLHGHSTYSDGTGTPEEFYRYARDVAALDLAVLTDHDHFGLRMLDENPELWQSIQEVTRRFHEPGCFLTLHGFEWTSWLYGHRHVLYFRDQGEIHSSIAEEAETPELLWNLLKGQDALTIAHHTGGGPVATDWSFAPPPDIEPVVEIISVHGNSEAMGAPAGIRNPSPGSFVVDALARGYRLGFVGSGDSHDGHPGLAHRRAATGGLVAILTADRTREGVLQALRQRRTYATSGARMYLEFTLGATPMGHVHPFQPPENPPTIHSTYFARVIGTDDIREMVLVKNGVPYGKLESEGTREASFTFPDPEIASGDVVYLRVEQRDRSLAWSSPIFVE